MSVLTNRQRTSPLFLGLAPLSNSMLVISSAWNCSCEIFLTC
jgi:hypothetical protein